MEQTDRSQRGGSEMDEKKLNKEHICICAFPMDTENSAGKAWGEMGLGWRRAKGNGEYL